MTSFLIKGPPRARIAAAFPGQFAHLAQWGQSWYSPHEKTVGLSRLDSIPVIDLFAGPGGLAEGFAAWAGATRFDVRLSLEMDPVACETLRLRKFYHLTKGTPGRNAYYSFVRGQIGLPELVYRHRDIWNDALSRVMNVELGDKRKRLQVHQRIRDAIGTRQFILVGGPPCQAYSIIGRSRRLGIGANATDSNKSRNKKKLEDRFYEDPKHHLYREYLEIIAIHRPIAFVMENVKGLSSARTDADDVKGGMFDRMRADLENPAHSLEASISGEVVTEFGPLKKAGYRLYTLADQQPLRPDVPLKASQFVVECEKYGIPQTRHRIIIIGIREDISHQLKPLSPLSSVSARDVLNDLPPLISQLSNSEADWFSAIKDELWRIPADKQNELGIGRLLKDVRIASERLSTGGPWVPEISATSEATSPLMRWLQDTKLAGALQHESRSHMASDLVRYLYCSAFAAKFGKSPSLEDWPSSLKPQHENVKTNKGKLTATGFLDRFKVQGIKLPSGVGQPSSTVTSHISKDGHYYIHYDPKQCRSLTVREAARLQSFPDNYLFCGTRTQQFRQVGNAVPPFLAKQIAGVIANAVC